ncbi:MAG TPA: IS200/IS605 family transposase [Thermoanaerobaculia bacterium]|jgi:REP element-mobilizing transposase RayT|nr:IS200/IS605 family transposase [Thermoanaerobaculia bacterium]
MPHSYVSLFTHIVYSTKDRTPQIDAALEARLFPYIAGIVKQLGGKACVINGVSDHVHLLTETRATITLAEFIGKVKGCSSKWIHDTFPEHAKFEWQRGYGAFSVSRSNVPVVARYIEQQKSHHRKATFAEEFRALLAKHDITVDEKYLWT